MPGCAFYRGRILSGGSRPASPAEALCLARHLAECAGCAAEAARLAAIERELQRLPEVDVPGSFSRRVMDGLRRAAPAVQAGVFLLAVAIVSGLILAGGLTLRPEILPRMPVETTETFGDAAMGFGRAVVVLLSCALRPGVAPPYAGAGHPFHTPHLAASLLLVAGLVLLVGGVLLSDARARFHARR